MDFWLCFEGKLKDSSKLAKLCLQVLIFQNAFHCVKYLPVKALLIQSGRGHGQKTHQNKLRAKQIR